MISVEFSKWKAERELTDGFEIIETKTVLTQVLETCKYRLRLSPRSDMHGSEGL